MSESGPEPGRTSRTFYLDGGERGERGTQARCLASDRGGLCPDTGARRIPHPHRAAPARRLARDGAQRHGGARGGRAHRPAAHLGGAHPHRQGLPPVRGPARGGAAADRAPEARHRDLPVRGGRPGRRRGPGRAAHRPAHGPGRRRAVPVAAPLRAAAPRARADGRGAAPRRRDHGHGTGGAALPRRARQPGRRHARRAARPLQRRGRRPPPHRDRQRLHAGHRGDARRAPGAGRRGGRGRHGRARRGERGTHSADGPGQPGAGEHAVRTGPAPRARGARGAGRPARPPHRHDRRCRGSGEHRSREPAGGTGGDLRRHVRLRLVRRRHRRDPELDRPHPYGLSGHHRRGARRRALPVASTAQD